MSEVEEGAQVIDLSEYRAKKYKEYIEQRTAELNDLPEEARRSVIEHLTKAFEESERMRDD